MPGFVETTIGAPPVYLTFNGEAGVFNVTADDIGPITIRRGRTDPDQRPQAATLAVSVKRSALPALPELGDSVFVNMTNEALAYFQTSPGFANRRFGGKVSDVNLDQAANGDGSTVNIIATGPLADVAGKTIPAAVIAAGTDKQQAQAIIALIGGGAGGIPGSDAASVFNLLALDATNGTTDARAAFDAMSADTGGELVEDRRGGGVYWLATGYRLQSFGSYPSLILNADEVLAPLRWTKTKAGMVNDLTLLYGPAPQGTYHLADEWSAAKYGTAKADPIATRLATYDDARRRGVDLVGRRGRPAWRAGALSIDLIRTGRRHGYTTTANVLNNDYGQLVHFSGIPADGPYDSLHAWREGDVETITADAWIVAMNITDYGSIGAGPTWAELPPAWTWATIPDQDMSWIGLRGVYTGS